MTPAQVEMQTERVQFEEPALSAEQMSANQAGAFPSSSFSFVVAVLHALGSTLLRMEGRRLCPSIPSRGEGPAGSVARPVSDKVAVLNHMLDHQS